jgi:hypothetical protein
MTSQLGSRIVKQGEIMTIIDRPTWPPGAEILCQCFDAYAQWKDRWSEDLEELEDDYEAIVSTYSYMMDGIDIDLAKARVKRDDARC